MIRGINHLTWQVDDLGAAFDFYTDVLGFEPIMRSDRSAYFRAGAVWIAITLGEARRDERYDHVAFDLAPADYVSMVERLRAAGAREWQENASEGESFYFLDPAGNRFELHHSDLSARIAAGKRDRSPDVQWFV